MNMCVVPRPKRPQLSDAIDKLDQMVDGLATAIPGAVAESIWEVLGTALVATVKEAVRTAVGEAVAAIAARSVPAPAQVTMEVPADVKVEPRLGAWARVKSVTRQLRSWAARRAAPVVARLALGWAVVKVVGGATVRSRSAALATALTGAVAGVAGYAVGPIPSAVLLGLAGGAITVAATWAAPAVGLLLPFRGD